MSQFQYALPAGRINKLKGEILAHAVPIEVLGITGQQRELRMDSAHFVQAGSGWASGSGDGKRLDVLELQRRMRYSRANRRGRLGVVHGGAADPAVS